MPKIRLHRKHLCTVYTHPSEIILKRVKWDLGRNDAFDDVPFPSHMSSHHSLFPLAHTNSLCSLSAFAPCAKWAFPQSAPLTEMNESSCFIAWGYGVWTTYFCVALVPQQTTKYPNQCVPIFYCCSLIMTTRERHKYTVSCDLSPYFFIIDFFVVWLSVIFSTHTHHGIANPTIVDSHANNRERKKNPITLSILRCIAERVILPTPTTTTVITENDFLTPEKNWMLDVWKMTNEWELCLIEVYCDRIFK